MVPAPYAMMGSIEAMMGRSFRVLETECHEMETELLPASQSQVYLLHLCIYVSGDAVPTSLPGSLMFRRCSALTMASRL